MKKLSLGFAALLSAASGPVAQADTIFLGAYPDKMITVDEKDGKVAEIAQFASGLPMRMVVSDDRKRIYVTTLTTGGVEVVDTATRKVLTSLSLDTPTTRYRFMGGAPDPTGRYFYTTLMVIGKEADRYTIQDHKYAVIDLQKKAIARMADMEEEDYPHNGGYGMAMKVSPDGKYLYLFQKKVVVLSTATLKPVKRFDIARPERGGLEDGAFAGAVDTLTHPGEFVSLFTASDPYVHNKVFGVGRFDLNRQTMDFTPIGAEVGEFGGFDVTPDGKDGYVVMTSGKLGNKRCEFWHFDMASTKMIAKAEFECRSRFYFALSGNGQKLYIYGAGHEIEIYDGKTLAYEKTWELNHDATMAGLITAR